MRLRAKTDANHAQIVKELRQLGYSVLDLSRLGKGCPDILVGKNSRNWLFELKDPNKPPSARKLSDDEKRFIGNWRGQVHVIHATEQALAIIQEML